MVRDDGAIMDVMISTFSGNKDEYGKNVVPSQPLMFDRVTEGRGALSLSPLFALPVELLSQIMQYLSTDDLGALALVNSDCRQLARSQQFKSVRLSYSINSSLLIQKLVSEASQRKIEPAIGKYLGSNIRRLTVATNPVWVSHRHNIGFEILAELEENVRQERLKTATKAFFEDYIPGIELALSQGSLPYLELLSWEDHIVLPKSFFMAVISSSIQHLRMFRVRIEEEFEIQLLNSSRHRYWPLKSLYLTLNWKSLGGSETGSVCPLSTSILRLCSPTLETLTWDSMIGSLDPQSFPADGDLPRFLSLRRLKIGSIIPFSDSSILTALLGPSTQVRELETDTQSGGIRKNFFATRGNIETLETFSCQDYTHHFKTIESLRFLRANPQLLKLRIVYPVPPPFLEMHVLPLLSESFYKLTSLSLIWDDTSISEYALEQISTLKGLHQLQLSAGEQFGWKNNWLVDHDIMRRHLMKLKRLRRLAFSRDSYPSQLSREFLEDNGRYYEEGFITPNDDSELAIWQAIMNQPDTSTDGGENEGEPARQQRQMMAAFKRIHCLRMVKQANQYCEILPLLEWMHIGKISMIINGIRQAFPLLEEPDDCWAALEIMFGLPNSGE